MNAAKPLPAPSSSTPRPAANQFHRRYGPWAVVTGASDGIGQALARELAGRGLDVVLVARRRDRLDALARELEGLGVATRCVALDLASPGASANLAEATEDLDVGLFVAAAGFGTSGAFVEIDPTDELTMVDLNCRAVVEQTHLFARRLQARGRGGVILFGSLVGFQGVPRAATYAASKAFVQSLAEGLALELRPLGVDVLCAAPGPTASGFADRAGMVMSSAVTPEQVARGTLAALGRKMTVRPGFLSWFLEALMTGLPRWARSRILARVMAGMTKHSSKRAGVAAALVLALASAAASGCVSFEADIAASRRYPEQVRWPETHSPEQATFFIHNEIEIAAAPEVVWKLLIEAETWPSWYEGASKVDVLNPSGVLEAGSVFTWKTMGLHFSSTVTEFEPYARLTWVSDKRVIQAAHGWMILPTERGCIVVTDESQRGSLTTLERAFQPNKMRRLHDLWLAEIKARAEGVAGAEGPTPTPAG